MALLVISLSVLFLSFCLGQVARVTITPSIAITALDTVVGLFVSIWIIGLLLKKSFVISPLWKSFSIFAIFAAFSLLLNVFSLPQGQSIAAFLYLVRFIVYGCVFFLIYSLSFKQKSILQKGMTISGLLMVVLGYLQFFLYPALRNLYYAGWDEHFYRMFGTFLDPNFLGLFFVLYILFLFFLFYSSKKKVFKFIYGFSVILTIGALFLTYSRSALLALIVGIGTFLFVSGHRKVFFFLISTIFLAGLGFFLLTAGRSEGTNMLRIVSSEARVGNMKDALTVWQDNLLFGVGFDAYRYAQHRHGIYQAGWEEGHGSAGADNSFLFVLATTGIIGLLAYLYFFYQHILVLKKGKNRLTTALGLSTIAALSIGSFFINGLFYPSLLVWLWMILGITESK